MKQYKLSAIILGFVFLCSALSVAAQSWNRMNFRTNFDFHIAGKKFEAGDYEIEKTGSFSDFYRIRRRDGKAQSLVIVRSANKSVERGGNKFVLEFNQHGNEYFLNTISNKTLGFMAEFPRSKAEVKLAREFAESKKQVAVNTQSGK